MPKRFIIRTKTEWDWVHMVGEKRMLKCLKLKVLMPDCKKS